MLVSSECLLVVGFECLLVVGFDSGGERMSVNWSACHSFGFF